MGAYLRWDHAPADVATARTGPHVPLMLGDDGRQFRGFGDLMPGRFRIAGTGVVDKGALQWSQAAGTCAATFSTRSGGRRWPQCPQCPGCPLGLRPAGALRAGFGGSAGATRRNSRRVAVQLRPQFAKFGL